MKNVFIDSNVWLSLYHFTSDDLEQFSKLKDLVGKSIKLYIPHQVQDEVNRNRDAKIKDALSRFEKFDFSFPAFCKSYEEYKEFSQKYDELRKQHKAWCDKIHQDIDAHVLQADKVIESFFELSKTFECPPEIVRLAELRYKMGNPPGKDNKYGDAINWECLLSSVPDGEDLFFISSDKDYVSAINDSTFNFFLRKEWEEKKHSKLLFFKSLNEFLKAHVKEIKLQTEQKKDELIEELKCSRSFAATHEIIAKLSEYSDWTSHQIDELCSAAINNFQVKWVFGDSDVKEFYIKLMSLKFENTENTTAVEDLIEKEIFGS